MITELTAEQKARFPEFVDKWTAIGLSTEPANRPNAEIGIVEAYRIAGLSFPRIVWCGSPLSQGITRAILLNRVRESVGESVRESVRASVGESVRASVWESVWESVRASVRESVWESGYGQHDAAWLGVYGFFLEACGLTKQTKNLSGLWEIAKNAGWFLPHRGICWVSERHSRLCLNERGALHCESGPALSYPDGWCIYALNGIRVKADYVLTPASKLLSTEALAEQNADIRRELIRKIGIERLLSNIPHKSMSKAGKYELLSVKLSDEITDARYLKMLNPSIGCFHLEGVSPECATVDQAINWRAGNIKEEWKPITLT